MFSSFFYKLIELSTIYLFILLNGLCKCFAIKEAFMRFIMEIFFLLFIYSTQQAEVHFQSTE